MDELTENEYLTSDQIDALRDFISTNDFKNTNLPVFLSMIDNFVRANHRCDERYLSVFHCIESLEYLSGENSGINDASRMPFVISASMCLFGLLSLVGVFTVEGLESSDDVMAKFMKTNSTPQA